MAALRYFVVGICPIVCGSTWIANTESLCFLSVLSFLYMFIYTIPLYKYRMGYDLDRFLDDPDPELICTICQQVYEKPLVTPCGHTFCGACIREWLSKKGVCPLDNKSIKGNGALRDIPISFRNMIGTSLKIRCEHRKDGCMVISKLDDLEDHKKICPFRKKHDSSHARRQARFRDNTQSQESDQNRFLQTVVTVFGVVLVLAAAVIFRR